MNMIQNNQSVRCKTTICKIRQRSKRPVKGIPMFPVCQHFTSNEKFIKMVVIINFYLRVQLIPLNPG